MSGVKTYNSMVFVFVGVGGQVDFIRGAALGSDGLGRPILAMPSTTRHGESKIVKFIKEGRCVQQVWHTEVIH